MYECRLGTTMLWSLPFAFPVPFPASSWPLPVSPSTVVRTSETGQKASQMKRSFMYSNTTFLAGLRNFQEIESGFPAAGCFMKTRAVASCIVRKRRSVRGCYLYLLHCCHLPQSNSDETFTVYPSFRSDTAIGNDLAFRYLAPSLLCSVHRQLRVAASAGLTMVK